MDKTPYDKSSKYYTTFCHVSCFVNNGQHKHNKKKLLAMLFMNLNINKKENIFFIRK